MGQLDFPLSGLKLAPFCSDASAADDGEQENHVYDLCAVSNHLGDIGGGHYTADCRNPVDGTWYRYNDSKVVAIDPREHIDGVAVYMMFYVRRGCGGGEG